MFKRILTSALAALLLASSVPASLADGGEASPLVADECAPYAVADGEIAVSLGTNGNELLACFTDKFDLTLVAADGSALSPTEAIASGATVSRGGESVTAIVPGDVTGDAVINVRDAIAAMKVALGTTEGFFSSAADVNADGAANSRDVIKLMRSLVGWNETLGANRAPAEAEDAALTLYFASAMQRIAREDTSVQGAPDGAIRLAKNEIEDAHVILVSTEKKTGLTLDVGDIANAAGDVLDREIRYGYYYSTAMFNDLETIDYGNITTAYWADPYPELRGAFDIGANESRSFIVKVKTTAESAAGWYKAPVRILDGEGSELKKAELYVYVWDFAIDDSKLSYTMFNTGSSGLAGHFGPNYYDGSKWEPWYKKWYDYVLENKMNLEDLPYSLYDSRVEEYLNDDRVTSFLTQKGRLCDCWDDPGTASSLLSKYNILQQNPKWLDKAYIYTIDEPWGMSGCPYVIRQWNEAKAALGDIPFQTIVPFYNNWMSEVNMDMTEYLWDYCNCFCPDSNVFTPSADRRTRKKNPDLYPTWGYYPEDAQLEKYGSYETRYEQLRERGDKMWWYICVTPGYPHANFFNYYQGAWIRPVLWQQFRYNSDGFLYWSMTFWQVEEHSTKGISLKRTNSGDGLLLYPGDFWYEDEPLPVPSIRFEIVRDSFEDFAYLRMLEAAIGRDGALEYSNRVTTDVLHFTHEWEVVSSVRDEMGFALEGLACKVADQ